MYYGHLLVQNYKNGCKMREERNEGKNIGSKLGNEGCMKGLISY